MKTLTAGPQNSNHKAVSEPVIMSRSHDGLMFYLVHTNCGNAFVCRHSYGYQLANRRSRVVRKEAVGNKMELKRKRISSVSPVLAASHPSFPHLFFSLVVRQLEESG